MRAVRIPRAVQSSYALHENLMREVCRTAGAQDRVADYDRSRTLPFRSRSRAAPAPGGGKAGHQGHGDGQRRAHDTQQMGRLAKVAMIFVRSKDGRSHTPEEFSSIPDIVEGIRLLAATLHDLAY